MTLGEIIAIIASALIIGGAVFYIIKAKKNGKRCIGCPDSGSCSGSCSSCKSCTSCPSRISEKTEDENN